MISTTDTKRKETNREYHGSHSPEWHAARATGIGFRCKCGCGQIARKNTGFSTGHQNRQSVTGILDRFMRFVRKTEACWLWTGAAGSWGYGQFQHNGKTRTSSRVAYELMVGTIPVGMCVLHRCDTPACVNPAHLFLGTNADNRADCVAKGRANGAAGELNCKAKLTKEQVAEIRRLKGLGAKTKGLAQSFGVHRTTIQKIANGRAWNGS